METGEEKYKKLIDKLKNIEPVLDNPEVLTEKIMSSLKTDRRNKLKEVILFARPWLSAAAIFLTGLFIYQKVPMMEDKPDTKIVSEKKTELTSNKCLTSFLLNQPGKNFFNSYMCYLKEAELKNRSSEQLIMRVQNDL